jgi:serine phosphatase RsbU (regulator of sigma subunit)
MQPGYTALESADHPRMAAWPSAEEMASARDVQIRLLRHRIPYLETLECSLCYLPARGIGGDYYDFIHLGLGRVGLALGDISGKGVPAALMMASLQAILRTQSAACSGDIARLLRSANRLFCECTAESHYASLFLGEYNDATRRLRYANCGQTYPLLIHGDFSINRLESTATVLGMFPDWSCSVSEIELQAGDTLLLFTDGVTEAMNESGEEFGESRLLDALKESRQLALSALVQELATKVQEFSGNQPADDLTLLVARSLLPAEPEFP